MNSVIFQYRIGDMNIGSETGPGRSRRKGRKKKSRFNAEKAGGTDKKGGDTDKKAGGTDKKGGDTDKKGGDTDKKRGDTGKKSDNGDKSKMEGCDETSGDAPVFYIR
jgi:hypothetical protein